MSLPYKIVTEFGRIIRFGMTGVFVTLVYAVVTIVISEMNIAGPMVATVIGYSIAATLSYLGHLYFSFRVEPDHRAYLYRFAITTVVTFTITMGTTWLFTEMWSGSVLMAIITVSVLIPVMSYVCNRCWVFLPGLKG